MANLFRAASDQTVRGRFLFGGKITDETRFGSDEEVWKIVERFERCEFGLEEFDHVRHLAVGMAYLTEEGDVEGAMDRMRIALRRFSAHHGKMGFHETITRFWLFQLSEVEGQELWMRANRAAVALGNKDLIFAYYDRERLMSDEARQTWVEPWRQR